MGDYVRGKYNTGKSLDIEQFSEEELREAIKDWSQGYESMEEFLWACYNNGIKTFGSNMGSLTYVDFRIDNTDIELLKRILAINASKENITIMFKNGSNNPIACDNLEKEGVSIWRECKNSNDSNMFIRDLTRVIKEDNRNNDTRVIDELFSFHKFFVDNKSDIGFISMAHDESYDFMIQPSYYLYNSGILDDLISGAGLQKDGIRCWYLTASSLDELTEKIKECRERFIEANSPELQFPKKIKRYMNFYTIYQMKKMEYGENVEGKRRLEEWLNKAKKLWNYGNVSEEFNDWLYQDEEQTVLANSIDSMNAYGEVTNSQVYNAGTQIQRSKLEERELNEDGSEKSE